MNMFRLAYTSCMKGDPVFLVLSKIKNNIVQATVASLAIP